VICDEFHQFDTVENVGVTEQVQGNSGQKLGKVESKLLIHGEIIDQFVLSSKDLKQESYSNCALDAGSDEAGFDEVHLLLSGVLVLLPVNFHVDCDRECQCLLHDGQFLLFVLSGVCVFIRFHLLEHLYRFLLILLFRSSLVLVFLYVFNLLLLVALKL
jgi:hypothetical protein